MLGALRSFMIVSIEMYPRSVHLLGVTRRAWGRRDVLSPSQNRAHIAKSARCFVTVAPPINCKA